MCLVSELGASATSRTRQAPIATIRVNERFFVAVGPDGRRIPLARLGAGIASGSWTALPEEADEVGLLGRTGEVKSTESCGPCPRHGTPRGRSATTPP